MVTGLSSVVVLVALCLGICLVAYVVCLIVDKTGVPYPFNWITKVILVLILICVLLRHLGYV